MFTATPPSSRWGKTAVPKRGRGFREDESIAGLVYDAASPGER